MALCEQAEAGAGEVPGGASLVFGFLDNPNDLGRYSGSSFSFVGFDELVRFEQQQYASMFRALRQPDQQTAPLPPAADAANPTQAEFAATLARLADYQEIFDSH